MKKILVLLTTFLLGTTWAMAQTALFTFNDGLQGGLTTASGSYNPGDTFTFDISLTMSGQAVDHTTGGTSYWFSGDVVGFTITNRSFGASPFSSENFAFSAQAIPNGTASGIDLGGGDPNIDGTAPDGQPPNLTYFIATLTISIDGSLTAGTYHIFNTDTTFFPKASVANDLGPGPGFAPTDVAIPEAIYTIVVVPEPATWSLLGLGAVGSLGLTFLRARRRS